MRIQCLVRTRLYIPFFLVFLNINVFPFLPLDSMDYNATNGEFTFSSSSLRQCVNIAIVDDSVSEQLETFSVTIDTSVDRVVLEPNTTVVEIVDNDGERERERERREGEGERKRWRVRGRW